MSWQSNGVSWGMQGTGFFPDPLKNQHQELKNCRQCQHLFLPFCSPHPASPHILLPQIVHSNTVYPQTIDSHFKPTRIAESQLISGEKWSDWPIWPRCPFWVQLGGMIEVGPTHQVTGQQYSCWGPPQDWVSEGKGLVHKLVTAACF